MKMCDTLSLLNYQHFPQNDKFLFNTILRKGAFVRTMYETNERNLILVAFP
jgi:hypothetical protein